MPTRPRYQLLFFALLLASLLATVLFGEGEKAKKLKKKELPEQYQSWLDIVDLIMSKDELNAFLRIHKDYQRDAFIERFWAERDTFPDTARNEFRDRWMARAEEAFRITGDLLDERSRVMLLNGLPDALVDYDCIDVWKGQVWYYQRAESIGQEIALLFYQVGNQGRYRLWYPTEGLSVLLQFANPADDATAMYRTIESNCGFGDSDAVLAAINMTRVYGNLGFTTLMADLLRPDEQTGSEWVETFEALSTEVPEGSLTFEADLQYDFPARHKTRTVVQGQIGIDPSEVGVADLAGVRSYNFVLTGEVLREEKLFDTFRYSFNMPANLDEGATIPLVFERYLRPGPYRMVVKLEDLNKKTYFLSKLDLEVPKVDEIRRAVPKDAETRRLLAEANAAISTGDTTIRIVPPRGDLQTGFTRIDTITTGDEIAYVKFTVDNDQNLIKRQPPFNVELDFGSLPRMRNLVAVAFDDADLELARDEIELNSGAHRFAVRLIEPRRGKTYVDSLRAEAKVDVPKDRAVKKVEFYLNEQLVASLHQPPFVQPILLPSDEQLAYVRAVAYQPDGNFTEDLVYVNAPDYLEEVDVQFVELFIAVLNKESRPVEGLAEQDFTVLEDGVAQTPMRFDLVDNLPIHAGILVDISASMEPSMDMAKKGALQFFEQAITPKDRATLITFNDHPNLAAKFTNDIQTLAGGLAGLKAERGTALYDSLIFSLYYFNGIKGQRALVVLSDGQDEHSRFTFENTLEYARRAGVSIYTIGLDLGRKEADARKKLRRFADETGGRAFFIETAEELPRIYDEIQRELRSRYYLAYQSTNASNEDNFRAIEVELARSGLDAKTLRGYYP